MSLKCSEERGLVGKAGFDVNLRHFDVWLLAQQLLGVGYTIFVDESYKGGATCDLDAFGDITTIGGQHRCYVRDFQLAVEEGFAFFHQQTDALHE